MTMKFSPLFVLLLATAGGTAFAQATSPAADPANPPTSNPDPAPTSTPPVNPASPTANPDPTARSQDPTAMQGSGPEDWNMVKGHDKGYITKTDALPNSWLAQNFSSCDADKDGKISEAEYQKCQKRH
jgi:hypothetical protein